MNKELELELFIQLQQPFPKEAYKDVSIGKMTFTSIDAYHVVERLTQVFGLQGFGWGVSNPMFETYQATFMDKYKGELECQSISCSGSLWYRIEDTRSEPVFAVGDGTIVRGNVAETKKKALTNLISKAASYIGVGLSVYKGLGLDDPYLDRQHLKAEELKAAKPGTVVASGSLGTAVIADHAYWYDIPAKVLQDPQLEYLNKNGFTFDTDKNLWGGGAQLEKLEKYRVKR